MDFGRTAELTLRLQHRHSDGSWSPLEPRSPHDAASLDPERGWLGGTVYVCKACDEHVTVKSEGNPATDRA